MRRLAAVAAAVLALVSASGGVAHAATPIQPGNRPTPLSGQTNGELPSNLLVRVNNVTGDSALLHRAVTGILGLNARSEGEGRYDRFFLFHHRAQLQRH